MKAASRAMPSGTPIPAPILTSESFDFESEEAAAAGCVAVAKTVDL